MDSNRNSITAFDGSVSEMMIVEKGKRTLLVVDFRFGGKFEDVDIVKIVEVLSVEASKDDHAATNKTGTVSSAGFG